MSFGEFKTVLKSLLPPDGRPIVAYSGLWMISRSLSPLGKDLPKVVLDCLLEVVGPKRTLFMPCFTSGFRQGVIDLDQEPGTTGMVSEALRTMPGSHRTASAFFSFACVGPEAEEAAQLRPTDAWGDGSFYEWMEKQDAHCLMIGIPRTQCSFLHRLEWLQKEEIPYRYLKEFIGEMIFRGRREPLKERLFVRDLEFNADNTWKPYEGLLEEKGMRSVPFGNGVISEMGAKAMLETLLPVISQDPFAFAKNAESLRARYVASLKKS